MTEDEAKGKACCGPDGCGRLTGNALSTDKGNGDRLGSLERVCIGSACMAWRTTEPAPAMVTDPTALGAKAFRVSDGRDYEKHGVWKVEYLPATGFCGLAGFLQ